MLTGKMVRVRYARDRIVPYYLNVEDEGWRLVAEQMLELFRGQEGKSRGEMERDWQDTFGDEAGLVHQGLAKLLEDRCEFEVVAGASPEKVRAAAFQNASAQRQGRLPRPAGAPEKRGFDRDAVLETTALQLGISAAEVEKSLFADLKSEQLLARFEDISPERLLERYNVALAQAVLLRAIAVHLTVRNEPPPRYRQLLRRLKFHRLLCETERAGPHTHVLHFDGPLSLFSATLKYGLQLALFLPAVLFCKDFELKAELRWGTQKKPKSFVLTPRDGLVPHYADAGVYVPPELGMFVDMFRKRIDDWELLEETEVYPLGNGSWVPDFRLRHKESGKVVLLEVLGFWRRSHAVKHLQRLRHHVRQPFLLAVSDQLRIDEADLTEVPAGIHRFRNMPLPDEVARLARETLAQGNTAAPP